MKTTTGIHVSARRAAIYLLTALLLYQLCGAALAKPAAAGPTAPVEKGAAATPTEPAPDEKETPPADEDATGKPNKDDKADKPKDKSSDKPAEEPAEEPAGKSKDKPADEPASNSAGYLLLVNWDNPYTGDAFELVRLDKVIDKNLVTMSNYHKIEYTAGLAANELFRAAKAAGMGKYVIDSVYRTVERQQIMWQKRLRRDSDYGENPYREPVKVLPGGMSEHATGLALDILAKSHRRADAAFGDTEEGQWLAQNAHKYGFILRYPDDKEHITGVVYEPWHFRYVGEKPATAMYEKNLCLEEYVKAKVV